MKVKSYKYDKGITVSTDLSYKLIDETATLGTPKYIFVPLKQYKGAPPVIMIEVGEEVYVGSILAKGRTCSILSPATGKVVAIEKRPSVYGGVCDHIIIETSPEESYSCLSDLEADGLSPEQILKRIFECGIVNNDGVPLYKKLAIEEGDAVDSIVINACTDEPLINSTTMLLNTMPNEIVQGIEYIVRCLGVNDVKIAMTNSTFNKLGEFLSIFEGYNGFTNFEIAKVSDRYPVGDESELIYTLFKNATRKLKKIKTTKQIVVDASCCFSVYQAVKHGYADDYKLITVTGVGEDGHEQKNVWVKVGMTIGDVLCQVGDPPKDNTKIIVGGAMRGLAVRGFDCSITKTTKGVIILSGDACKTEHETQCNGCGKCAEVCPKRLLPYKLDELSQNEDYEGCKKFGAEYCTKCGCCSYVCPTKRNLVQRIVYAKDVIEGKGGDRI